MIHSRPSRLRVLLVTLIVSAALVLAQARQANASGAAGVALMIAFPLIVTYFTVVPIVCTPIAAVKASGYPGGFSGAFKDCFYFELKGQQLSSTENNPSDKPTEAEKEGMEDRSND
ncbi:MAG: hypothetical protein ACE5OQ_13415 [Woeseia sp.]